MSIYDPKVIVASYEIKRHFQTYENLEIWINVDARESFLKEIYSNECEIFGLLPKGIQLMNNDSIKNIVNIFQQYQDMRWIVSKEKYLSQRAIFMRKDLVDANNRGFSFGTSQQEETITVEGLFKING